MYSVYLDDKIVFEGTQEECKEYCETHKHDFTIPKVEVEPIPEDALLGMWEATPEEQEEIDDIIANLGIDFD